VHVRREVWEDACEAELRQVCGGASERRVLWGFRHRCFVRGVAEGGCCGHKSVLCTDHQLPRFLFERQNPGLCNANESRPGLVFKI
jgi:hypothetical protein